MSKRSALSISPTHRASRPAKSGDGFRFTAVVVSHANPSGLRAILGNLRYQSRPPDETLVYVSDPEDLARIREQFPEAKFTVVDNMNDFGHAKRAQGIGEASGDYLGFFNDDDSYDVRYLEKMLAHAPAPVVYCGWSEFEDCEFRVGSSTAGNFIVSAELAREVGYQGRDYAADGQFIGKLAERAQAVKEPSLLYFHNTQER